MVSRGTDPRQSASEDVQPASPNAAGANPIGSSEAEKSDSGSIVAGIDPTWARSMAAAVGIPERVFLAYAGAARRIEIDLPKCGLDWATIAAVGYVESLHGTVQGGSIDASGQQRPRLVGPPLDGKDFARILDTDNGEWDGDKVYDRAIGPMQFIPRTWRQVGRDGSGDGVADPQNIDDAALSAARLLCRSGGDLTTSGGWISATTSYNNSVEYNNQVAVITDQYRNMARQVR